MSVATVFSRAGAPMVALIVALFVSSCGGSSTNDKGPTSATGTVGLFFTDKPSDDFSAIKLNVVEAVLIGGDNSQQILFQGSEPIDLLDLTNFNEPIIFGEVHAGIYTKLRLRIDALELVPHDGSPSIFPALPANGKIDMLDPSGIEVLPGRTLIVEIDMDANKSIHIVKAGNSNRYNFRPVVKAKFMDGGMPHKLARVEGIVSAIPATPSGSFLLCDIETPDHCIDVRTGTETSIFDDQGAPTGFDTLMVDDIVVVIGRYDVNGSILLNALILEIGGNAEQLKGIVVSSPMDSRFLMLIDGNGDIEVELQSGTKFFDETGEIGADAIVIGADIEVEGVRPVKSDPADADVIRAALVFVEAEDDEQLSGTIIVPLVAATRSFGLTPDVGNDTCVRVDADADILLVDAAASEVTLGTFDDLAEGQSVDLFGTTAVDSCFDANEVIVEVMPGT
jgi:hypothetical protein